jgi:hypothetical protein
MYSGLGEKLRRTTTGNSRFAKAGVSCFYDSEVLNSSFVHLMKFSAKKTRAAQSRGPLVASVTDKTNN